ncbi:biotin-independent malonate decarboxylase subunit gamma [Aromatoleum petrolei]|uniref:Biotin-independent malonate decarboxylase subunit gamma n=1 Tax=Aromatoleum petrolei TaxID=76116 RepID=A0ABX1MPL5_9RHOO|nr:biotin-independent malonate decarboxylase subunit gamma [Aromatoleum petrolei]NMF87939.1 biotin-independent malonate decarboxylase subunit gamma [Aromatoleum petrolei]QTQ36693.1 Biotin-independent malonate decarboxylase, gamma subunit [Aromatoleum petrolei]
MEQGKEPGRGAAWLAALTNNGKALDGYAASVRVVDAALAGEPARYIAVVRDAANPFPRVRNGEVGLVEAWMIARAVREVIAADAAKACKRPIVAVIDVASQAYGRREEAYGIHQALAGAAAAYADARLAGHPVIGLIVGKAMSGALLAHGYQANRLIALDDPAVMVHAMGKAAAARVTLRSVEELDALAATIPPMAYDIGSFAQLGLLWRLLRVEHPDAPSARDLDRVDSCLAEALADIRADTQRDLSGRLKQPARQLSQQVRDRLRTPWRED